MGQDVTSAETNAAASTEKAKAKAKTAKEVTTATAKATTAKKKGAKTTIKTKGAPPPNNTVEGAVTPNLQNMVYAATNPEFARSKAYKGVLRYDTDAFGVLRNLSIQNYKDDYSEGIVRYLATVLRVENKNTSTEEKENSRASFGWFDSLMATISPDSDLLGPAPPVEITAVVDCGIHAACFGKLGVKGPNFSLPNENGQGGSDKTIDRIRDAQKGFFIAKDSSVEIPLVGELVWVTWQDLKNFRGGIYLGPLISRVPPAQGAGTRTSAAGSFNSAGGCGLSSSRPAGSSTRSSNSVATSKTGNSVKKESIDAKKERGKKPIGKGVFTGLPDIATHKIKIAEQATLNWVCFTGIIQIGKPKNKIKTTKASLAKAKSFVNTYQKKGIRTYIMGFPVIGHEEKFINDLINMASKTKTIGVIINLDSYVPSADAPNKQERASYLMETLKKAADEKGFCVGLTAANITSNTNVPWKIFVPTAEQPGVDFVVPQVLAQLATRTKESFVNEFRPWKMLGFKHIVPALGMIGKSPPKNGWRGDGYNTIEKSPWRMREDAIWTLNTEDPDSVIGQLGKETVANAVIWWDWEGATTTATNWPEKRWDIIRELADAEAAAEKLNSLKDSEMDKVDKERIKNLPLGELMKRSDSPTHTQKAKKKGEEPPTAPPASKPFDLSGIAASALAKGKEFLNEGQKKVIQKQIDEKQKALTAEEKTLAQLKGHLKVAETSPALSASVVTYTNQIKEQQKKVSKLQSEINKLRGKLAGIGGGVGPEEVDPCLGNVSFDNMPPPRDPKIWIKPASTGAFPAVKQVYNKEAKIQAVYGATSFTTNFVWIDWFPYVPSSTGKGTLRYRIKVNKDCAAAWQMAWYDIKHSKNPAVTNYKWISSQSHNGRCKSNCITKYPDCTRSPPSNPSGPWVSNHAFGIAMDINPFQNNHKSRKWHWAFSQNSNNKAYAGPKGHAAPWLKCDMSVAFIAIFKRYGLRWGGDYRSKPDPMHFEFYGDPKILAATAREGPKLPPFYVGRIVSKGDKLSRFNKGRGY